MKKEQKANFPLLIKSEIYRRIKKSLCRIHYSTVYLTCSNCMHPSLNIFEILNLLVVFSFTDDLLCQSFIINFPLQQPRFFSLIQLLILAITYFLVSIILWNVIQIQQLLDSIASFCLLLASKLLLASQLGRLQISLLFWNIVTSILQQFHLRIVIPL